MRLTTMPMVTGWRGRALDRLAGAEPWLVWAWALGSAAVVTIADWWSHAEVAASLLYLVPIGIVAWGRGRVAAAVFATLCAALWLYVDVQTHGELAATPTEIVNLIVLLGAFLVMGQVLARLRGRLERERWLARTDPLTGIHNRRAFWNATARELERCRRFAEPFSVAYLDVDGFKGVNDRHGHRAGDVVLRAISEAVRAVPAPLPCIIGRIGGEEFAVLLDGATEAQAASYAEALRLAIASTEADVEGGLRVAVTASFGLSGTHEGGHDLQALLDLSDRALYRAKHGGRDRIVAADSTSAVDAA